VHSGVHIGHIGRRIGAADEIRACWQARGAVFMHHSLEPGEHESRLDESPERSPIVFHARGGAAGEPAAVSKNVLRAQGEPPILLEANSVAALAEALAASLPLT
jgi:hypothetical protein